MFKVKENIMNSKAKKIGTIVTVSIIGALILATIIMTFVPYSFKMDIATPDRITVYDYSGNKSASGTFSKSDKKDIYNNILDKFDKAFEQSVLNAMFNGDLGKKAELKTRSTQSVSVKTGNYLKFGYDNAQKYKVNGGEYSYNQIIIDISYTEGEFQTVKAYIVDSTNPFENYSKHYYEVEANFTELANYISSIRDSHLATVA